MHRAGGRWAGLLGALASACLLAVPVVPSAAARSSPALGGLLGVELAARSKTLEGTGVFRLGTLYGSASGYERFEYVIVGRNDAGPAARLPATSLVYMSGTSIQRSWSTGVSFDEALANGWLLRDSAGELIGAVQESAAPPATSDFARMLMNPSLLLLTANYAAVGYYEYTLFYWMKYYFSDVLKYPEQTSRYFTFIVSMAMVFAMPLGGILSDALVRVWGYRWGRAAVPIFGMLASAILLFVATRVQGQLAVVSLFFLAHFAIGLCEAPTWVAGLEIGGKSCGTSAAIVNMGGNLGGLLAPIITIYVAKQYGWNAGFLVASLACLLGVVLWLGIRLKHPATGAAK